MLQRIQTVFLLILIVVMGLYLVFPIWTTVQDTGGTIYRLYALFLFTGPAEDPQAGNWTFWPYCVMGIIGLFVIILAIIETFSFKKRLTQIKIGAFNSLLLAGVLVLSMWFTNQGIAEWTTQYPGSYNIGIFFPAVAILFNLLANRFIRKDEKLVRSMDRIR